MRKWIYLAIALAGLAAGLAGLLLGQVSLATLALIGAGAVGLGWLVVLVTLPWNLYFGAKAVLFEIQRSRERGIAVRGEREAEARRVERRMLRFSLGAHLGSAALAAGGASLLHAPAGYGVAGLFLLSTAFRPGVEYYRYLRERLGHILAEVHFPREDAVALRVAVDALQAEAKHRADSERELRKQLADLQRRHDQLAADLDRRLLALGRKFEETLARLTDNQELISGVRAFLRLVQQSKQEGQ